MGMEVESGGLNRGAAALSGHVFKVEVGWAGFLHDLL